jgi:zinc transporter ZupT
VRGDTGPFRGGPQGGLARFARVGLLILAAVLLVAAGFLIVSGVIVVVAALAGSDADSDHGAAFSVLVGAAAMIIGCVLAAGSALTFWGARHLR